MTRSLWCTANFTVNHPGFGYCAAEAPTRWKRLGVDGTTEHDDPNFRIGFAGRQEVDDVGGQHVQLLGPRKTQNVVKR